jgi:hypothetical protein
MGKINLLIDEITEFEGLVNTNMGNQNGNISKYKTELQTIVDSYKTLLKSEMDGNRNVINQFYNKTVDTYNKTLLEVQSMTNYVDRAITDIGSIAEWAIIDDKLTATVFNSGIINSVGMTTDGRMEVTVNA